MKLISKLAIGAAMAGLAAVGSVAPASAAHVSVGIGVGAPGYYGYGPGYGPGYYDSGYYYDHPCYRPYPYRPDWCYHRGYYGGAPAFGVVFGLGGHDHWHGGHGWHGGWHH